MGQCGGPYSIISIGSGFSWCIETDTATPENWFSGTPLVPFSVGLPQPAERTEEPSQLQLFRSEGGTPC